MKVSKEVKVGLLAVVAIALLYVGFSFLKGIDFFDPSNTYYVLYDNVDGLTESNPVKVNGYRVGRVGSITLLQEGEETRMLVGIEVSSELKLYENSIALLQDEGILGGKSVTLRIQKGGSLLNDEDTLRGQVDIALTQMIKDKADPIIADVDTTLTRVNSILGELSGSGRKVENTISQLQEIVLENRRDINAITSNVRGLTEALNDPRNGVKPLLLELNQFADSLNSLELKKTVANANQALANLQQITRQLQAGQGSLGKLLQDDSLYVNLNQSSADLDRLLIDLRENPERYLDLRFSIFGGKK